MASQLDILITTVRKLSPREKLTLLQILSADIQESGNLEAGAAAFWNPPALDIQQPQAGSAADIQTLAADWWPADETADDINRFVATQRHADRGLHQ